MLLVSRESHLAEVECLLKRYRVVALLGARQVGKSTLARQVVKRFRGPSEYVDLEARPEQCYFWGTQSGAELDLLIVRGDERRGFEVKYTDAPALTPSMRSALEDLKLDSLDVLYPGTRTYSLQAKVRAVPVARLLQDIRP